MEVPVGFKWFAPGLFDGTVCFGGEESAGASFLQAETAPSGRTDKDGIIMDLLAAEITAVTGKDPGDHYRRPDGASSAIPSLHPHRRARRRRSRRRRSKS